MYKYKFLTKCGVNLKFESKDHIDELTPVIFSDGTTFVRFEDVEIVVKILEVKEVEIIDVKYLNNIVEQDHRFIKIRNRLMLGLKSLLTAKRNIAGIEAMHMNKKDRLSKGEVRPKLKKFIHQLSVLVV